MRINIVALYMVIICFGLHFEALAGSSDGISISYPASPMPTQDEFDEICKLAQSGDAQNQLYMGVFYANGSLVQQNYSLAAHWYLKSARQGNAAAQCNLGFLYEFGIGVERNHKIAFALYKFAADQNDAAAHLGISRLLFSMIIGR